MPHLDDHHTTYQTDTTDRLIVHVPGDSVTAWAHNPHVYPDAPKTRARVFSNGRQGKEIVPKTTKSCAACVDVYEPSKIRVHMDRADFLAFADDIAQAAERMRLDAEITASKGQATAKLAPKVATKASEITLYGCERCPKCTALPTRPLGFTFHDWKLYRCPSCGTLYEANAKTGETIVTSE